MPTDDVRSMAHRPASGGLLIEGAMGLFDGAPVKNSVLGKGSVADLAVMLDLPVVLVVDVARQGQSVAAMVAGMASYRDGVKIAGVILNRVGSQKHREMVTRPIEALGIPVLGAIMRDKRMARNSRHLGLVQAGEDAQLDTFIEQVADVIDKSVDVEAVSSLGNPVAKARPHQGFVPLGQRMAIAKDEAFAFAYPHILDGWKNAGAEISFFSPLADEGPAKDADAVYLPGGYPELHAGKLANNSAFKSAMQTANAQIYGECGGYMVLGEALVDAQGVAHKMMGLLPVTTSFAAPKLHLGYRTLSALDGPYAGHKLTAHEFHYAQITDCAPPDLFDATDSLENDLGTIGHRRGRVSGSFAHIIMPPKI